MIELRWHFFHANFPYNDDDIHDEMVENDPIGKVAGDRPLTKKLTDFVLIGPMVVWTVSGALEVHSLALKDKLKGREAELTEEIINATCTDGDFNEVSEYPSSLSSPSGHPIVPRLLFRVLGVGAAAAEQRRRPQPADEREGWI